VQAFFQEKEFVCRLITDVTASLRRSRDFIFVPHTCKMRVLVADFLAFSPNPGMGWGGGVRGKAARISAPEPSSYMCVLLCGILPLKVVLPLKSVIFCTSFNLPGVVFVGFL